MKFTKQTIYIGLFAILYLIVAFSSFWHACAFFGLANNSWMSIILAFAFEIGQAAVLFSLLTSKKDRSRIMPWVLMTMFTLVQVIGNVFSSYKYIINNSVENLRFFKEPIFIWTTLPDDQATVIVTYVVGAILPIAALLLTSMITNYLSDQEEAKQLPLIDKENLENLNKVIEEAPEAKLITEEDGKQEEKSNNDNRQQPMDSFEDKGSSESKDTKDQEIEELKKQLKNYEENPLINEHSILQMENQGLTESNQKKDEEIENLKKQLEELKYPKIKQIPSTEIHEPIPFSEPEGLKKIKEELNDLNNQEHKPEEYSTEHLDKPTTENGARQEKEGIRAGDSELSGRNTNISEKNKANKLNHEPSLEDLQQAEALMSGGNNRHRKPSHFIG